MLQKIENFYLGILRVVVIGVAGLLLAAVAYFGVNSMGVVSPAPKEAVAIPKVTSGAYRAALMGQAPSQGSTESPATSLGKPGVREEYVKAAKILDDFYARQFSYPGGLDEGALAHFYGQTGETYATEDLNKAFAVGFLARVSDIVTDPGFVKWTISKDPGDALGEIMSVYKADFDKQLSEVNAANESAQAEHLAKKAASMQMLYVAGVSFLAFLLIVFLSIIIRIERNLRPQPQG